MIRSLGALTLLLALTACGGDDEEPEAAIEPSASTSSAAGSEEPSEEPSEPVGPPQLELGKLYRGESAVVTVLEVKRNPADAVLPGG